MNKFLKQMINNLESAPKPVKIGFPDGDDLRIAKAINQLKKIKNVEPVLINKQFIEKLSKKEIIEEFIQARKNKKETITDLEKWSKIPNYIAMALLRKGMIDCVVGGAVTTTAELLRPALQVIGAKTPIITSFFWMNKGSQNYFLGDCAVNIDPNLEQISVIAEEISANVSHLFNIKPFIAMLSFSTNGSGDQTDLSVQKMHHATNLLKTKGFNVLGETQFDAAFDYNTRKFKWKQDIQNSPNIYIFPNLNAGNIGYKIMKLTGKYEAIGPIVVGLNKPVNDLSRGADVDEIVNLSIITLNMALKGVR